MYDLWLYIVGFCWWLLLVRWLLLLLLLVVRMVKAHYWQPKPSDMQAGIHCIHWVIYHWMNVVEWMQCLVCCHRMNHLKCCSDRPLKALAACNWVRLPLFQLHSRPTTTDSNVVSLTAAALMLLLYTRLEVFLYFPVLRFFSICC